jgi:hypothetical protein
MPGGWMEGKQPRKEKIMRALESNEVMYVGGGEWSCASAGDYGSGYVSCWDSSQGVSFTISYDMQPGADLLITGFIDYQGAAYSYSASSMQALAASTVGTALTFMAVGVGATGGLAAGIGTVGALGFGALWKRSRELIDLPQAVPVATC